VGALDYKNHLQEDYLNYFGKELKKVQNGEVDLKVLVSELKTIANNASIKHSETELFDYEQVNTLITQSYYLLDNLEKYDEETKNDVIAAISYFVNEDDAISDSDLLEGFDDDFAVMLAVVEYRGLGGPMIKK